MRSLIQRIVAGILCVLTVVTIHADANTGLAEPQPVSIIKLISSPREYNGVRVHLTGYLDISRESNAVYLHEEDYRFGMTKNAIRLTLRRDQEAQFKPLSRKHVIIEGTFTADEDQMGMFSGHIVDVTRVKQLLTEEEFRRSQSSKN